VWSGAEVTSLLLLHLSGPLLGDDTESQVPFTQQIAKGKKAVGLMTSTRSQQQPQHLEQAPASSSDLPNPFSLL